MSNQTYLTDEELKRYDRHLKLSGFGLEKQLRLKQSRVLLVGAGGLGCPIGLYLAASGVGTIGIADDDTIEVSNLQRQIAFSVDEIDDLKSKALAKRLMSLNPLLHVTEHPFRINESNVEALIKNYDLVIDGTDNFATRFLLADTCFLNKISYLHASVYQYEGQISLFLPGISPCFRCLFRQPPNASALPACGEAGILGVVTGTIGLMAATEAIKYLAELGNSLSHKVLIYAALTQQSKQVLIEPDENCPLCPEHGRMQAGQSPPLRAAPNICTQSGIARAKLSENMQKPQEEKGAEKMPAEKTVSIEQAAQWMKNDKELCLLDVRETHEYEQGHIADAALLPLSVLKTLFNHNSQATPACSSAAGQEQLSEQYLAALPGDKVQKILCYCRRGGRSLQATDILRHSGFANTFSMDGGFEAWQTSSKDSGL